MNLQLQQANHEILRLYNKELDVFRNKISTEKADYESHLNLAANEKFNCFDKNEIINGSDKFTTNAKSITELSVVLSEIESLNKKTKAQIDYLNQALKYHQALENNINDLDLLANKLSQLTRSSVNVSSAAGKQAMQDLTQVLSSDDKDGLFKRVDESNKNILSQKNVLNTALINVISERLRELVSKHLNYKDRIKFLEDRLADKDCVSLPSELKDILPNLANEIIANNDVVAKLGKTIEKYVNDNESLKKTVNDKELELENKNKNKNSGKQEEGQSQTPVPVPLPASGPIVPRKKRSKRKPKSEISNPIVPAPTNYDAYLHGASEEFYKIYNNCIKPIIKRFSDSNSGVSHITAYDQGSMKKLLVALQPNEQLTKKANSKTIVAHYEKILEEFKPAKKSYVSHLFNRFMAFITGNDKYKKRVAEYKLFVEEIADMRAFRVTLKNHTDLSEIMPAKSNRVLNQFYVSTGLSSSYQLAPAQLANKQPLSPQPVASKLHESSKEKLDTLIANVKKSYEVFCVEHGISSAQSYDAKLFAQRHEIKLPEPIHSRNVEFITLQQNLEKFKNTKTYLPATLSDYQKQFDDLKKKLAPEKQAAPALRQ